MDLKKFMELSEKVCQVRMKIYISYPSVLWNEHPFTRAENQFSE